MKSLRGVGRREGERDKIEKRKTGERQSLEFYEGEKRERRERERHS